MNCVLLAKMDQVFSKENKTLKKYWTGMHSSRMRIARSLTVSRRILRTPLWTEFLTHASENITLPQTSFAGGKNWKKNTGKVRKFCHSRKVGTLLMYTFTIVMLPKILTYIHFDTVSQDLISKHWNSGVSSRNH